MLRLHAAGGYAATGAPLVVKDKIIVGMAGGEHSISGFLDAYDAVTGKRVWRFNTIPQPGEPNFGTWAGDSWKTGGVTTWNNGSYDPETNTVFWGTSNPVAGLQRRLPRRATTSTRAPCWRSIRIPGKLKWHLPVHSARHARLGRHADPDPAEWRSSAGKSEADGLGRAQRFLLPARPQHRKVPSGEELRAADLGQGLRRQRPAGSDPRQRSHA